jgi:UDP-GlcNAc3NAcA epimerase
VKPKILQVTGARPQFIKAAVTYRELRELGADAPLTSRLVHTGQHYDTNLSDVFFAQLGIPQPDYNLAVGSAQPWEQLGQITGKLVEVITQEQPQALLVYGDTTSTLAAALASQFLGVPLIHVEAGERLFARVNQPEELNRILTDHAAWLCLAATQKAADYLAREGFHPSRVKLVGDPMYDLALWGLARCDELAQLDLAALGVAPGAYCLATIHRAENTATPGVLLPLLEALDQHCLPVIMPLHPRTSKAMAQAGWQPRANLRLLEPVGYFELLKLLKHCERVVTDSGGLTREALWARKPALLPVLQTCWHDIVDSGWACLTGHDGGELAHALTEFTPAASYPEGMFGDGRAARKIILAAAEFAASPGMVSFAHRAELE